jgi:hypothetical protein
VGYCTQRTFYTYVEGVTNWAFLRNNSDAQDDVVLRQSWKSGAYLATAFNTFLPKELRRPPATISEVVGGRQLVCMLAAVPTKLHLLVKELWVGEIARAQ